MNRDNNKFTTRDTQREEIELKPLSSTTQTQKRISMNTKTIKNKQRNQLSKEVNKQTNKQIAKMTTATKDNERCQY